MASYIERLDLTDMRLFFILFVILIQLGGCTSFETKRQIFIDQINYIDDKNCHQT
jgi:hypothetical protein